MSILDRRQFLAGISSVGLSASVGGCALVRPLDPRCPVDPLITDPTLPLAIDSHAHVFNGSDLQVAAFFKWILVREYPVLRPLAALLEGLARGFAPSAGREISELRRVSGGLPHCDGARVEETWRRDGDDRYKAARRELQAAARDTPSVRFAGDRASTATRDVIEGLPLSYEEYQQGHAERLRAAGGLSVVVGGVDFVIRNFQYRYVNVFDYLDLYSSGKRHKIDLIVSHLVDYDWPIAMGEQTDSSFADQIRVMEQISVLTGGRVHCFAPFDPMKQVAHELGHTSENPLQLIRDAVENRGFIGVKLYPPMGFRPYGNTPLPTSTWNKPWFSPLLLKAANLGELIDGALLRLYSWCRDERVPIMAHTSRSNGPDPAFELFTEPYYWTKANGFPEGLHVDFGHFGDTEEVVGQADQFARLMSSTPASQGEFFYADSSYFTEALTNNPALKKQLRDLYRTTSNIPGVSPLAQRLMYGTDWEMIAIAGRDSTRNYLSRFEDIYADLDRDGSLGPDGMLSRQFFGRNAAQFLELYAGGGNRTRLDRFYGLRAVPKPMWAVKIDDLTA
jgi:hypothetical protein